MASEPIRSTSVVNAPKDYSIPNAQQIRLLSVRASFIDNSAGADWLPALQVLDNNGNVLVTAADPGVKVTAGSDAEVSWFPGVKVSAASTATAIVSQAQLYLTRHAPGTLDPVQTIPSGVATPIAWHGRQESGGGSPGGILAPAFGATTLTWGVFGDNIVTLSVIWPAGAYDRYIELTVTHPLSLGTVVSPRLRTSSTPDGDRMTLTANISGNPNTPTTLAATLFQASGADKDISAEMYLSGDKPAVALI